MEELNQIIKEIDEIETGYGSGCRYECKLYDWSVGACIGECEEYIKKKAKEIVYNHLQICDNKWISVGDRLPPPYQNVIVSMYNHLTWVTIGKYNAYREKWEVDNYITDLGIDVKAWQPLPDSYH